MRPKKYYVELYHVTVLFFVNWPKHRYDKYIKRKFKIKDRTTTHGQTEYIEQGEDTIITIYSSDNDPAIVAHECVHAANMILQKAGVHASFDNDEPQAYLVQLLMEKGLSK